MKCFTMCDKRDRVTERSRNNRNLWSEQSRLASETIGLGGNRPSVTKCRYNFGVIPVLAYTIFMHIKKATNRLPLSRERDYLWRCIILNTCLLIL